ncbi:LexA family transcriptional regulator [Gilliamella sp. Gris1-4]|jgi:phage repressor protein C with HTH and peptisase S24 domain|uniref:LexA family transcriptional regulator n=1 Tax=Gilliamella sp. Gris1-4 TaxID=3120244 RepID=UPI00080E5243|nr:S24 family peptidase [Gilliamella apicola]OCG38830.1 hypothetical protein A9G31_00955 [Gilliamella apicola]
MNDVIQRLNEIMIDKNIKQSDLAKITGVTNQAVNNWFKRNKISTTSARTICLSTGYSLEWLLSGKGVKKMDDSNIRDSRLKPVTWEEMSDTEKNSGEFVTVPVLDIELSAGHGMINHSETEMYTLPFRVNTLKREGVHCDKIRVVRVSGDSMNPRLFDGDTLSIDMADNRIKDGKIYAIRIGESQKVKVLIQNSDGTITVRSFNPDFKDEIISKEQIESGEFAVLGRVWWISSII